MGYGVLRFIAEFFREPDAHIGFDAFGWMTAGSYVCAHADRRTVSTLLGLSPSQPMRLLCRRISIYLKIFATAE